MTTHIAIQLPDEVVKFLDRSVAQGLAESRAALVSQAVEREMRRQAAMSDSQTLTLRGAGDDLDELVAWSVANVTVEDSGARDLPCEAGQDTPRARVDA